MEHSSWETRAAPESRESLCDQPCPHVGSCWYPLNLSLHYCPLVTKAMHYMFFAIWKYRNVRYVSSGFPTTLCQALKKNPWNSSELSKAAKAAAVEEEYFILETSLTGSWASGFRAHETVTQVQHYINCCILFNFFYGAQYRYFLWVIDLPVREAISCSVFL